MRGAIPLSFVIFSINLDALEIAMLQTARALG